MKQTIRFNTFETNSSSTHSLTIMTQEEFNKFKTGELKFDRWGDNLVPISTNDNSEDGYWDYENFGGNNCETDITDFTTPSGDKMVAICYFGYDG